MFEKRLWKSDVLSRDAGHLPDVCFKHFVSESQLPGFYISGTKFSCGGAHHRKGLIAIFRNFFASANKIFILEGGLDTGLSFYGV